MIKFLPFLFGMLLLLGAFTSCGDKKEASKATSNNIDTLLTLFPDSIPVLLKHGTYYFEKYNFDRAMPSAAKAFRLDSNNIEARMLYAQVLNNRPQRTIEEVMTAQRHFMVVHRKQPKNTKALVALASTYSLMQDFEKSFQYLNEALRVDKRCRDAYVMKGTNYLQLNKMELAKSSYETAVQQDSDFFEGYLFLGSLYQSENNPVCIEYYITAAKIKPNDLEVLYSLAYAYQVFNRLEEAKQTYREMYNMDSTYAMPLFQQGYIKQFMENDLDSAMIFYNDAIVIEPKFVEAWHNLGLCYEDRKDRSRALQAYSKALKYNPNFEKSREAANRLR
jgi:tetratricopeptide (TPR) repeat protein